MGGGGGVWGGANVEQKFVHTKAFKRGVSFQEKKRQRIGITHFDLSNTAQSCSSEQRPSGSRLERRLPRNSFGSCGIITTAPRATASGNESSRTPSIRIEPMPTQSTQAHETVHEKGKG